MSQMTLRWGLAASVVLAAAGASVAQQGGFPFDRELILDARPMPGSKRIPNMDIAANGTIALEMWCDRVEGQVVVAGDTITIITGQPSGRPCPAGPGARRRRPARCAERRDQLAQTG